MHAVTPCLANQTTMSFKNEVSAVVAVAQHIFCSKLYKKLYTITFNYSFMKVKPQPMVRHMWGI
jgi:hypothetical protein